MKRIRSFISSSVGFAVTSNVVTVLISLVLFRPFWEESDDIGMALLAEGAYGYHEPHILYTNTVYGSILCFFQKLVPGLRWHALFIYLFAFIASTAFVYMLSRYKRGKLVSIVFLAASFYEVYVALQFSKASAYIAMLAWMVLFETADEDMPKGVRRALMIPTTACLEYALILRQESFMLATLAAGVYGICLVIRRCIERSFAGKIRAYLRSFGPAFLFAAILLVAGSLSYSSGAWKDYMQRHDSITDMTDNHNGALLYTDHEDELTALGVSENDALMYITYEMPENDAPSLELMADISALDVKKIDIDLVKAWVANIYNDLFSLSSTAIGLLLLLGLLLAYVPACGMRRFYTSCIIVFAALSGGILFYYQYSSRWSHRVVYALLLVLLVMTAYLLRGCETSKESRALRICFALVLIMSATYLRLGNEFKYQDDMRNGYDYEELTGYMRQNKDRLFVADVFTMIDYGKYDVFAAAAPGQFDNCIPLDSVFLTGSPVIRDIAGKYGYKDAFGALSSRDGNVILVDAVSPEVELTYCNEHGDGKSYILEPAGAAGGISLYTIR